MKAPHRESGFTLIELMLAITILGIIIAPLTAGLMVALRTTDETSNRLQGSNDAQLLSFWLPPDIQSAGSDSGNADPNENDVVFAPTVNTECSGRTNVLRLEWAEKAGTSSTYDAAYVVEQAPDGSWRLVRYLCVDGEEPTTNVVARNLAGAAAVSIAQSGTQVSMTVSAKTTPTAPSGYTFTVSGTRRTP